MIENKKEFKLITKKNPKSLLPNALTIFGVCLGLSSIKFALDANYAMAIVAIGFAAILDTLDGRVARLIKGTSKVGKELDSLTDVISFGVAPGFIMYFWALNEIGKFGWMFVIIYTVCCALRLARFNSTTFSYFFIIRNRNLCKSFDFLHIPNSLFYRFNLSRFNTNKFSALQA